MKKYLLLLLTLFTVGGLYSQEVGIKHNLSRKGQFYFYWGWNRSAYTVSDIAFNGKDYNFRLNDVVAFDRPTPFTINDYFNPRWMTIPQYNSRIGYFFRNNYDLSFGVDHMKYVVKQFQTVDISGEIHANTDYDGIYPQKSNNIPLTEDFLKFQHTDGLNYINIALRRFDNILSIRDVFSLNITEGLGIGILVPRTDVELLGWARHDAMHLAGYGLDAALGLNITFFERYFIQSEIKSGYINMPSVRTTALKVDKAHQDFFFGQFNVVFGVNINTKRKERKEKNKQSLN